MDETFEKIDDTTFKRVETTINETIYSVDNILIKKQLNKNSLLSYLWNKNLCRRKSICKKKHRHKY